MKNQGLSKIRSRMKSHMVPILILLTGILLISILYWEARKNALEQLRKQFLMDTVTRASIIHDALKDHLIDLEGLRSFYNASTSVTRKAFTAFVASALKTRPGIQAFEWIPRVAYPERARFEAEARLDGLQDYQIYQLDPQGNKVAAGLRQYYYLVYYVEPLAGNEPALGFDLGSNPARLAALEQAADTGQPVATERITLVQETGSQSGFLIFIPIYRQEMPLKTVEQRRIALQGFVLGVFRAGDAVEAAIRASPEKGLLTELVDLHGVADKRLLYRFEREQLPLKAGTWETLLAPSITLRYEYPFTYASRQWKVDIIPSPAYVQGHISLSYWLIPPIGVLLTLSLALYFLGLLSHKESAENLVAARTAELVQANEMMQAEITERRRAEEALRKAEERYRSIFENAIEGIFQSTPEGIYIGANTAMAKMFGYESPEDLMANISDIKNQVYVDPQRRVEFMRLLERDGFVKDFEYEVFRRDGSTFWISENARVVKNEKGEIYCYEGFMQDIAERQRSEAERLRFSKLESLGTLAGGIAHDFNNILTAILGNIGLAALDDKIGPRVQDRLAQAEAACLRAQALSQQLITFAKGGAPVKKLLSVAELLTESTVFACVGSPVRCETTFPENLWWIEADPGQIDQVFQNLTINAVQAMPIGGTIKVWAENLTLGTDSGLPLSAGRYIKISLRDQGMGIPAEHLPRIFDPYFTTKQKGSGLGLASAYAIVEKHHGHIAVESKPRVGTTFHIYLPAVEGQVTPQPEGDRELPVGTGKILVMDDEEMVREVLGGMLAHLGYEAEFARDGGEAIEMFVQAQGFGQAFAAVILDLTVPGGMGGKETMARLREIDPQVKAVVSSGYSDDPIMADFQKYGFTAVIAKPYKVAELGKVLNKILIGGD